MSRVEPSLFKLVYKPTSNLKTSLFSKRTRARASLIELASLKSLLFILFLFNILINR
ncbi:hypothetical protein Hanom_Chr05g00402481 [Helianthus anomalus]